LPNSELKLKEYHVAQYKNLFELPADPEERAEIFIQGDNKMDDYSKSEIVQRL
jgi:hypothetical protein